jgi:hypothetical protein
VRIRTDKSRGDSVVELQVRTIFEEAWSEIDHRVRYPRVSDEELLEQFLAIFSRLAGSADEMGTFIKQLSLHLTEQREKQRQLEATIADLKVNEDIKLQLQRQLEELKAQLPILPIGSSMVVGPSLSVNSDVFRRFAQRAIAPDTASISIFSENATKCQRCGQMYSAASDLWRLDDSRLCPNCRSKSA